MKFFKKCAPATKSAPVTKTPFFERVLNFGNRISIGFILFFALMLVVGIGSILVYSKVFVTTINRQPTKTQQINISSKTKAQLTQLTQTSPQIKFILISEVDINYNSRINRWWFLDDIATNRIRVQESFVLPLPLYNTDPRNTLQMVDIMNNEFVCSPFEETLYAARFAGLHPPILTICQLAIPLPRQGTFTGLLVLGLKTVPTKEDKAQLRLEASRIAVELYLRGELK